MTPKTVEAVVEGGVLRPLKQLELPEQQHVLVTIVAMKDEVHAAAASCYDLALQLGVIGTADDMPKDLGTNETHFDGFGR
jgi:predicted DNA-binding antitoxin AbrB/MazE fold protein